MRYAETGVNLEIDLSRGNVEKDKTDPKLTELYLGGLGTNAKILWDRVPPETDPLAPENIIIFSAGILDATPAPSANRTIISSFSPQTRYFAYSMMGGFFGPELKLAGYDKVVVRGKAPKLSYLWIHNDKVEIRDATHLKGKGSLDTAEAIRQELKDPKIQICSIGLAGENKVSFASIEQGKSSASRGGLGAVMGSKNLKAIAVRGTKDINIARPAEFMDLCNQVLAFMKERQANPLQGVVPILARLGSPQEMLLDDEEWHTTNFAWGNARLRRKDFWQPETEKKWTGTKEKVLDRLISCYNCPLHCGGTVNYPGIGRYMMKCYSKLTYTMAAMEDLDFGFRIVARAQQYGVDGFTTPQTLAFAMELYEAGILTDQDMGPDFPKDNQERFFWLLDRIVNREGIGDILADGTYWAAKKIGKGAEAYAHNVIKKHEQLPLKLGMLNPIYFLMYCTGEKINITQIEGQFPQEPFPTKESREEFAKDWIQVPDPKFIKYFMEWEPRTMPLQPPVEACFEIVDWMEMMHYIDDSTGLCAGSSSFPLKPPYHIHNLPKLIAAATGMALDEAGLTRIARRTRTLIRAINSRRGLRRPEERPPDDHWKKRFPELEEQLLDGYYTYRGFNKEGIPTREELQKLDMVYVAEDLEQRGILKK